MIFEGFCSLVSVLLQFIFTLLPDLPSFDVSLLDALTKYVNLIFNNLGLLGFFVDINAIKPLVPLVILVINFERIYHFIIWLINKIPFLDLD